MALGIEATHRRNTVAFGYELDALLDEKTTRYRAATRVGVGFPPNEMVPFLAWMAAMG
jgi:hypothetical protein